MIMFRINFYFFQNKLAPILPNQKPVFDEMIIQAKSLNFKVGIPRHTDRFHQDCVNSTFKSLINAKRVYPFIVFMKKSPYSPQIFI